MVRLRGICLIHPAELRPKNAPQNDPVAARVFYLPEKYVGPNRGHCKADLAETWGYFSGSPAGNPPGTLYVIYISGSEDPKTIYIYIYIICPENTYYHRHTIPRKISARKKVSPGYTKYIRAKNLPA